MLEREKKFLCWLGKKYGGYSSNEEVIKEIENREKRGMYCFPLVNPMEIYADMIDEIFRKIAGVGGEKCNLK